MATPVVSDLGEMYRAADVGAIASIMSRLGVDKSMQSKLEDARQTTQQRLHRSLREYRNMFAVQHRTSNRLLFPESLRLLPLYTLAICKSLALRGGYGDTTPDERSAMGFEIMTMSISRLLKLLYPAFFRIDEFLLQVCYPTMLAGTQ
jgi:protein transport protein SEC24